MEKLPILDSFIKSLLEENHKRNQINNDKYLCKTQVKNFKGDGTTYILKTIVCRALEEDPERVTLTVEDINELIEQSTAMLRQAFNTVPYHKRIQTCVYLMTLLSQRQKKLLGESFKSQWYQTLKTEQKCQ